jgi:hypothetical protein
MKDELNPRLKELKALCDRLAKEGDAEKYAALVAELNRFLDSPNSPCETPTQPPKP